MKNSFNKIFLLFLTLVVTSSCSNDTTTERSIPKIDNKSIHYKTEVFMSPHEGQNAFNKIYKVIREAEKYIHLTLYSWSDAKLFQALKDTLQKDNPPLLKIVLHRPLYLSSKGPKNSLKKRITELESLGAVVKAAKKKMHEKFLIIDDKILMNGSANMSAGPLTRYSENIIFYSNPQLIEQFKHEFSILFNSATDLITKNEKVSDELLNYFQYNKFNEVTNLHNQESELFLVSSSMNYSPRRNDKESVDYKNGQYLKLKLKKIGQKRVWSVTSEIIKQINKAQDSILVCLNHLTLKSVKDALLDASKRGVQVKWLVDNHEYRYLSPHKNIFKSKEQTPFFVREYKEYFNTQNAPVRVKWYSLAPNPRYALLNHHKFILIDYKKDNTVLVSGSSNISKTAEFSQFDNMVIHKGSEYEDLFESFKKEFNHLWMQNRDESDLPESKLYNKFISLRDKYYITIHKRVPLSLTWNEVTALRNTLFGMAKNLRRKLSKHAHCGHFHVKKEKFYNYNISKNDYVECKLR